VAIRVFFFVATSQRGCLQVDAAVRNGTHYCDIAGEVHFMCKTLRSLHDTATNKNVKVVHSCGFDSTPSDLGTLLLVEHMAKKLQKQCARVDLLVNEIKGAQSGGSLQSMFEQFELPEDVLKECDHPFCLNPRPKGTEGQEGTLRAPTKEEKDQFGMRYNKALQRWTYPFQFSPINTRVVRRSAALLGYSPNFRCASGAGHCAFSASVMQTRFRALHMPTRERRASRSLAPASRLPVGSKAHRACAHAGHRIQPVATGTPRRTRRRAPSTRCSAPLATRACTRSPPLRCCGASSRRCCPSPATGRQRRSARTTTGSSRCTGGRSRRGGRRASSARRATQPPRCVLLCGFSQSPCAYRAGPQQPCRAALSHSAHGHSVMK
jgi:short subunit dehydrogenase-like uncharacterized protein